MRRVDVTVSNDSAILYDCSITLYWYKKQLYKSVLGRFKSECNKTITSCPSGQFNLERVSLQIAYSNTTLSPQQKCLMPAAADGLTYLMKLKTGC